MATQKVRPDPGHDERQRIQRRKVNRTITFGSLAVAAIVGAIVVLIAVLAFGPGERNAPTAAVSTAGGGGAYTTGPPQSPRDVAEGPKGSGPEKRRLILSHTGYVVYVWTDHRTAGLPHVPFPLGDGVLLDLLQNAAPTGQGWALTTKDARRLVEVLNNTEGLALVSSGDMFLGTIAYAGTVIDGIDINRHPVDLRIEFRPTSVPSRYAVVLTHDYLWDPAGSKGERPPVKFELPARVQDLFRRGDRIVGSGLEVTTDEARMFAKVLSASGFRQDPSGPGVIRYTSDRVFGIDVGRHLIVIEFHPVLPAGRVPST